MTGAVARVLAIAAIGFGTLAFVMAAAVFALAAHIRGGFW